MVVVVVTVVRKINFDLLNWWNSVRESYVVPVTLPPSLGLSVGLLSVASLHLNLLFSGREVREVTTVSVYLPAGLSDVIPPLPQSDGAGCLLSP